MQVVKSAPHSAVLREAALAVTHAGHGVTIKSLAAGVPLVCLPMGRDQLDIAARVVHAGAGVRLEPTAAPAEIASAVEQVLGERPLPRSGRAHRDERSPRRPPPTGPWTRSRRWSPSARPSASRSRSRGERSPASDPARTAARVPRWRRSGGSGRRSSRRARRGAGPAIAVVRDSTPCALAIVQSRRLGPGDGDARRRATRRRFFGLS